MGSVRLTARFVRLSFIVLSRYNLHFCCILGAGFRFRGLSPASGLCTFCSLHLACSFRRHPLGLLSHLPQSSALMPLPSWVLSWLFKIPVTPTPTDSQWFFPLFLCLIFFQSTYQPLIVLFTCSYSHINSTRTGIKIPFCILDLEQCLASRRHKYL